MSVILRSLMRDPMLARPLSRAMRRFDDDFFFDDWPARKVRRVGPLVDDYPVALINEMMNRQMSEAVDRMNEFAEELDSLDSWVGARRRKPQAVVQRTESGGLQLALDVDGFKPEDLKIKLVDDNLVVEALNETSGEDSYHKNQFKRWFKLPEDCKFEEIKSKLTNDNRLLIDLPSNKPAVEQKTRQIPIEMDKNRDSTLDKKKVEAGSAAGQENAKK